MGTTLTGTTPQDTYDSLIKVTDNGPLSGTLKALSDGLGNDSTLSLSTAAASIAGTLAVTGNATFDTTTLFVDAANNRVGVGTGSPNRALSVNGILGIAAATANTQQLLLSVDAAASYISSSYFGSSSYVPMFLEAGGAVRLAITTAGNVGIGTSAPTSLLHLEKASQDNILAVVGQDTYEGALFLSSAGSGKDANIVIGNSRSLIFYSTANSTPAARGTRILTIDSQGIKFGTDTAAANALDDYEEGTWTMGISFGGAAVGVTYANNTGTYTKIGRQVTINGLLELSSKGSSSGAARITGLPFTIPNTFGNYSAPTLRLSNMAFLNQFQGYGEVSDTTIRLQESTSLGVVTDLTEVEFANNSGIIISFTYFV
jgi:hypothetical protein